MGKWQSWYDEIPLVWKIAFALNLNMQQRNEANTYALYAWQNGITCSMRKKIKAEVVNVVWNRILGRSSS